jgi:hypothetical protein
MDLFTPPAPPPSRSVILAVGQLVPWIPSPTSFAQVAEVRRTCVRLVYVTKRGTILRPVVSVQRIMDQRAPWPLPLVNPLSRGFVAKERTFNVK